MTSGGAEPAALEADTWRIAQRWNASVDWVLSVAVATVNGRPVIVSGGSDGTVVAWSPATTAPERETHRLEVTTRLVSDLAAREDVLDVKPIANAVVSFLDHPRTSAPLSIAVKGP